MFKYTKDGVSVLVVLDTRRAKANGKYPVKVQVAYLRKQKYYGTGKDLDRTEWSKLKATKQRELIDTREQIEASFHIVRDYVRELTDGGCFTFDALNLRLKGAATADINTTLRARYEEAMNAHRYNTASIIRSAITSIEDFAGHTIPFAVISTEWLHRYEQHEKDKGRKPATIQTRMAAIRAALNEATKCGIIKASNNPFAQGTYSIKGGESNKRALTIEQIRQLASYEGTPTREAYRDYWLFIYFCNGINIADLARLKYRNIENGELTFTRQKTAHKLRNSKPIKVVITPQMQDIINRLGQPYSPDAYIFPILSKGDSEEAQCRKIKQFTKSVNTALHTIGKELGIGKITTYTARHSFATTLKRSGVNIAYISDALGHTNIQITETYLASFEREEREKNAQILADALKL